MRTRSTQVTIVIIAAGLAATAVLAAPRTQTAGWAFAGTTIANARPDGRVLELATGSRSGRCSAQGDQLACQDGARTVRASLTEGCIEAAGGARCSLRLPGEPSLDGEPPILVDAEGSDLDIECEVGARRGRIFTISDGDGTGLCAATVDGHGRHIGGTCTKSGRNCTEFDCEHGCGSGGSGCKCDIKKIETTVTTEN